MDYFRTVAFTSTVTLRSLAGNVQIRPSTASDIPDVRAMLREYIDWIGLDLAFQEIDAELAGLPGEYVPPRGALFVAEDQNRLVAMMGDAQTLYVSVGFHDIAPYYETPIAGMRFMALRLRPGPALRRGSGRAKRL